MPGSLETSTTAVDKSISDDSVKDTSRKRESSGSKMLKPPATPNFAAKNGGIGGENLEETVNSTASKEFSFGTSHNLALQAARASATAAASLELGPKPTTAPQTAAAGTSDTRSLATGSSSPSRPILSPAPRATPNSDERRRFTPRAVDDDDEGNEFTFGTSKPIQLPDLSQLSRPSSGDELGLRQAGKAGEECRELALLTPVQEGNEGRSVQHFTPPRAPSPLPPAVQTHTYVSPRLPSPMSMQPQLQPQPGYYQQPMLLPPTPPFVIPSCETSPVMSPYAIPMAMQEVYPTGHDIEADGYVAGASAGHSYGSYYSEKEEERGPPLAYRLALMCDGTCEGLKAKKIALVVFMLIIVAGLVAVVAFLLTKA